MKVFVFLNKKDTSDFLLLEDYLLILLLEVWVDEHPSTCIFIIYEDLMILIYDLEPTKYNWPTW
jgi:hypothetical protein